MASVTPVQPEISSELLLNKIMNNQVKTSTGKTITSAGRTVSSRLSATGYAAGASAGAVAGGLGYVQAAQDQTTEMVTKLNEMQKQLAVLNSSTNGTAATATLSTAKDLMAYVTKLTNSGINGQSLFTGKGILLDAGMGSTIKILNKTIAVTGTTPLGSLNTALGALTSTFCAKTMKTATDALNAAIGAINGYIGDYGVSYNQLRDRTEVLNDLATGFNESAAGQAISGASGASALLGNMLGS